MTDRGTEYSRTNGDLIKIVQKILVVSYLMETVDAVLLETLEQSHGQTHDLWILAVKSLCKLIDNLCLELCVSTKIQNKVLRQADIPEVDLVAKFKILSPIGID